MRRSTMIAVAAVAVMGAAAWTVDEARVRTEPAPVDVMLEAVAETEAAPETAVGSEAPGPSEGPSASEAPASSTSLASRTLRPRAEWDLPRTHNARVQYWIEYLAGDNRDRMRLWLEREGRYGPMLRERLVERGMPQDLVYLAMIESGLSARAYSHAHASGLWQFISATGRRYGLDIGGYVDERRDPVAATDAALDYLSDLYDRFGSWYLAAAAYNSGENRVERVLRQRVNGRKGDDALFWMIDEYLPRETRDYVPLMLAAAHIGKDPGTYGFHEVALQAPMAFDQVEVPGGLSLATVAEASDLDLETIRDLNPHLVRGITPPGDSWRLRVPVESGAVVAAAMEALPEEPRRATVAHRVMRGETLSHIARRYGVDLDLLRASNGYLNPRRLQVGQRIQIPVGAAVSGGVGTPAEWRTYRVRRGDSLWAIARRHGVTVGQLRSWNGVGSRIYPGQTLRIRS